MRAVLILVTSAAKPPEFHLESVLVAAEISVVVTSIVGVKSWATRTVPSLSPLPNTPYEGVITSRENLSF